MEHILTLQRRKRKNGITRNNMWNKFYECQCKSEFIATCEEDGEMYMAFFKLGGKEKLSLKQKIRWCWHIWRHSEPFLDMVILSPETAGDLSVELDDFYNKYWGKNDKL